MIDLKNEISLIIQSKKSDSDKIWMLARLMKDFSEMLDLHLREISGNFKAQIEDAIASIHLPEYNDTPIKETLDSFGERLDNAMKGIKSGTDGKDGKDGKNIKGDKGDRGEKGERGEDGVGIKGDKGDKGIDGKDGSPDTAKEIVSKINSNEYLIDASKIKGLPKVSFGGRGGGGGDLITLTTTDGSISGTFPGTQFVLSKPLKSPMVFCRGTRKTETEDYTVNGTIITFLSSQVTGPITVDGQAK
jgi:hypothetical protein